MTDTRIRTIIVDDEELARRGIELRLAEHPDFELVAQCANGREAVEAVTREHPDVMFLDIQMPGLTGFDVLARVPQESLPIIVFVTAFDRFALDAFEANALDYLLKPINEKRFVDALERVRTLWRQRQALAQREQMMRLLAAHQGAGTLEKTSSPKQYADHVAIRDERGIERLPVERIDWIDAAGDYMCIHASGRTYVLRETMKALETILDPQRFQRVHRSTIVNLERVRRLRPYSNGEYFLTLIDGQEVKLSRSYRDKVHEFLHK